MKNQLYLLIIMLTICSGCKKMLLPEESYSCATIDTSHKKSVYTIIDDHNNRIIIRPDNNEEMHSDHYHINFVDPKKPAVSLNDSLIP